MIWVETQTIFQFLEISGTLPSCYTLKNVIKNSSFFDSEKCLRLIKTEVAAQYDETRTIAANCATHEFQLSNSFLMLPMSAYDLLTECLSFSGKQSAT